MKIALHVIRSLDPAAGGPSVCVPQLAQALTREGRYRADVLTFPARGVSLSELASTITCADVLHVHGLWQLHSTVCTIVARRVGVPMMISAHGMLEPWALNHKRWRKRIYGALVEGRNLRRADCLHALTQEEAAACRRFGLRNPVALVANGIETPPAATPAAFLSAFPALDGRRLVLFLGRIHRKKGLDRLFRAWHEAQPAAHLVLAGGDCEGTEAALRALASELGIAGQITFTGPLYGDLKWSALAAAELFALPSYSEGFSVAVLEAMAMGLPVLLTTACHFPEAVASGAGWQAGPEAGALARVLGETLALAPDALRAAGERGRTMAATRYSWTGIAGQMAAAYDWMLGGPAPACLITA